MRKQQKVHSLTGRINEALMHQAFRKVKRNRGAAGVDRQSIAMFAANLEANLLALMKQLKAGTYTPKPLRRKVIDQGGGKIRPLGIPAVRDRVAQEVLRRLIEPYFEPAFSDCSYGFRPNRNCHQALREVIRLRKLGFCKVLDADIKGFFDNIPHELIIDLLAEKIADGNILRLIRKILNSGVMQEGKLRQTIKGTPQGGVISPMLANITLDVLDRKLADAGYIFVRYADDFLVLGRTTSECEEALQLVRRVVEDRLSLKLSNEKTKVTSFMEGFDFLGFHFTRRCVSMRAKSVEKLKDKIRMLTIRSHNFCDDVIDRINRVIRGAANYYSTEFSNVNCQFARLDHMIRRRLRCMKKKRISRKDNFRIRNRYFQRRGLMSFCALIQHS